MKERTKGFIAGIIASTVVAGAIVGANAQEIYKNVAIAYNNIKICLDGTYLEPKDANGNKVEPFTLDGTTYLPVRAVASAFGKEVDWDGETNTVYLGKKPQVVSNTSTAVTLGMKNALISAKEYLFYMAFSYNGLLRQLKFEGYTDDEAKYGVDNCGANWYEQAEKSAKEYLEYSAFSKSGLIHQLEFEGFTHDQAVYGVEQNGY